MNINSQIFDSGAECLYGTPFCFLDGGPTGRVSVGGQALRVWKLRMSLRGRSLLRLQCMIRGARFYSTLKPEWDGAAVCRIRFALRFYEKGKC